MDYRQSVSDRNLNQQLDQNLYDNNDLVKISLPLSNAYQNDWSDYQRVDGEISFDGKIYKYVKQKVENGQLVLLCIPDHGKMQSEIIKEQAEKNNYDATANNKATNNSKVTYKSIIDEFISSEIIKANPAFIQIDAHTICKIDDNLNNTMHRSPEQPPDNCMI